MNSDKEAMRHNNHILQLIMARALPPELFITYSQLNFLMVEVIWLCLWVTFWVANSLSLENPFWN